MEKQCFFDGSGKKLSLHTTVTAYGAAGDGLADDTSAIQAALNAKKEGGTVYFPAGTYKITQPVFFYSDQILIFQGGATLLQGASMDNLMMNYSTAEMGAYDATQNVIIRCHLRRRRLQPEQHPVGHLPQPGYHHFPLPFPQCLRRLARSGS